MSLLAFLKTGPGMAAAGGAGIGGAMLTMWGAGVAGTNINYSYVEFPNEKPEVFLRFQKGKDNYDVLESNWKTFIGGETDKETNKNNNSNVYRVNDYYGALSTSCMAIMFPHMPFHWGSHFKLDNDKQSLGDKSQDSLKVNPTSSPSSSSPIQGCAGMVMTRQQNKFLFTSEVSMRKGNRGISLWTAAKSANNPFTGTPGDKAKIKIRQFISFFEWSGGDWRAKGGYSWGGKELELESWTIKSPDGEKIKAEFKKGETNPSKKTDTLYYGVWKMGETGEEPFGLESSDGYTANGSSLSIDPLKAKGYKEADAFMEVKDTYNNQSKPWKQYCTNSNTCNASEVVKVDVKDSLDTWFEPFKGSKGSWTARPTT